MGYKNLFVFIGAGIIVGLVIGIILRELAFPGPAPPGSYDGFIGLGEISEKMAKLLLIIPSIIGGIISTIIYAIKASRSDKT